MNRILKKFSIWSILAFIGGAGLAGTCAGILIQADMPVVGILVAGFILLIMSSMLILVESSRHRSARLIASNAEQRTLIRNTAGSVGRLSPIVRRSANQLRSVVDGETPVIVKGGSIDGKRSSGDKRIGSRNLRPNAVIELKSAGHSDAPVGHTPALAEIFDQSRLEQPSRYETRTQLLVDEAESPTRTVRLGKEGWNAAVDVDEVEEVSFDLSINLIGNEKDARAALFWCKAYDENNNEVEAELLPHWNAKYGWWAYAGTNTAQPQWLKVAVPDTAKSISFGLIPWKYDRIGVRNAIGVSTTYVDGASSTSRTPKSIRVVSILDDFSYECFRFECDLRSLTPQNWKNIIDDHSPDLFLCESAWAGLAAESHPWKGRVYASERFGSENRRYLLDILEYCKERGIPTAFWNKEDPSHYEDKAHNFVETALLFDHIFTTDTDSRERYVSDYGHPSVHVLPFGVQPRLYNPIQTVVREDKAIFAGAWYENHEVRCDQMRNMFDSIIRSGYPLEIRDRFMGSGDPWHEFPREYQEFIKPPVPHAEVAQLFKASTVGMTMNTVTDSPSMFARRIFELMASNTLVVSNYSVGVERFFGDRVLYLDRDPEALQRTSALERERIQEQNVVDVLSNHSYEDRFSRILDACLIPYEKVSRDGSLIVRIRSMDEARCAYDYISTNYGKPFVAALLVVDKSVPGTLSAQMFQKYNTGSCNVVDEALLADGTVRRENLIPTEYFYYIDQFASEALQVDLEALILHASYYRGPIVPRTTNDRPYSLRALLGGESFLAPRSELSVMFNSTSPREIAYAV